MKVIVNKVLKFLQSEKGYETVRYLIIGVATTMVSFGSYFIMYRFAGLEPNLANILSIILAVLFAYITNKIYVFRSRTSSVKALMQEFIKFVSTRGLTMIFEIVGVFLLYSIAGLHEMLSKGIVSIGVLIGNYILAKLFVFKNSH